MKLPTKFGTSRILPQSEFLEKYNQIFQLFPRQNQRCSFLGNKFIPLQAKTYEEYSKRLKAQLKGGEETLLTKHCFQNINNSTYEAIKMLNELEVVSTFQLKMVIWENVPVLS